jgi:hypothetical protein
LFLYGGGPSDSLQTLKSLNLAPKETYLGKPEKLKTSLIKYPILSNKSQIGYLICDDKGNINEFSLPSLERIAKIKDFPHFSFFLNSHATASAILMAYLGFKGNEPEKAFIASLNVFIEKCLCNLPGKPLIYDIKQGLEGFAKYKGKNLEIKEIFASEGKEKALDFYKREIDSGRPLIVSFIYDKEGRNPQRARERRDSDSYFATGYLQLLFSKARLPGVPYGNPRNDKIGEIVITSLMGSHRSVIASPPKAGVAISSLFGKRNGKRGEAVYLILYDGKQIIAKDYMGNYPKIIILGARVK